jgi:hypothetical protein
LGERIHCQICEREISAVAASSIRLKIGTQPLPASHEPMYWMPTLMLLRSPASVIGASGRKSSRSFAVTCTSSRCRRTGWAPACAVEHLLRDRHQPGCATQVPSQPSVASRSLSARTLAIAASLAAGVVLDRDLRRHAAHRVRAAAVAGLHQQQRVGAHERRGHRHLRAVGEAEVAVRRGAS